MAHIKTPNGELKWVSSIKAKTDSFGSTNYEASHIASEADAKAFNEQFEASLQATLATLVKEKGQQFVDGIVIKRPYHPELNEDGTPTGRWKFVAKAKAVIKTKKNGDIDNRPKVVDADKKEIVGVEVANGSEGVLVVEPQEWFLKFNDKKFTFSMSLPVRLKVIQVTKLIPFGERQNPLDVL